MTRIEALQWIGAQAEDAQLDDADVNEALRALGHDPHALSGDAEDPIDRRWDTACAEWHAWQAELERSAS